MHDDKDTRENMNDREESSGIRPDSDLTEMDANKKKNRMNGEMGEEEDEDTSENEAETSGDDTSDTEDDNI